MSAQPSGPLATAPEADRTVGRSAGVRFWLPTLLAIWAVHLTTVAFFQRGLYPHIDVPALRPFAAAPEHLLHGWDGNRYKRMFTRRNWVGAAPPLYPMTLRVTADVLQLGPSGFEKAAVLLNMVSHAATVWGVYVLCGRRFGPAFPAWFACFFLFFFPGHNVFFASYAESFFLALSVWAFVARERGSLLASSLLAGLSALVRHMGVFLCVALLLEQIFLAVRARRPAWRLLLSAAGGLAIALAWHGSLALEGNVSAIAEHRAWTQELIRNHVPGGEDPRWWVFKYLAFSTRKEVWFFWAALAAGVWSWRRRFYLDAFYLLTFYASLAVYTYRPFPWSRYVSVFFPLAVAVAHLTRGRERLQAAIFAVCVCVSIYFQTFLFLRWAGEP